MIARITNPLMVEEATELIDGDGSPGRPRQPNKGYHVAIDNIRQRLEIGYGESAKLVTKRDSNSFQVELRCPTVQKNYMGCMKKGINGMSCRFEHSFVALIGLIKGSVRMINGWLMTRTALDAGTDCHWVA